MRAFLIVAAVIAAGMLGPSVASGKTKSKRFRTDRPVRVVVMGGSISMYYKGNYGQFLQHACKNIEVVNRAKVGAGGAALVRRFKEAVLKDKRLLKQLHDREAWLLFQGGLNSVFSPEMTNWHLARMFKLAADTGLRTFALTLTPWGREGTKRFDGFEGVRFVRATKKVNKFLLGKLTPDRALGRRASKHPHEWMRGELPELAVDVFNSDLRDKGAALRPEAPLRKKLRRSRYRRAKNKDAIIAEARAVPRNYMKRSYRDFDHIHPGTRGHKVLAARACTKAPKSWGCDCGKIKRASWKRGKVIGK